MFTQFVSMIIDDNSFILKIALKIPSWKYSTRVWFLSHTFFELHLNFDLKYQINNCFKYHAIMCFWNISQVLYLNINVYILPPKFINYFENECTHKINKKIIWFKKLNWTRFEYIKCVNKTKTKKKNWHSNKKAVS